MIMRRLKSAANIDVRLETVLVWGKLNGESEQRGDRLPLMVPPSLLQRRLML